jgi:hypothetical protein
MVLSRGRFSIVASWDDVRRIALALPEAGECESRGRCQWRVKDKLFVWELSGARETVGNNWPGALDDLLPSLSSEVLLQ